VISELDGEFSPGSETAETLSTRRSHADGARTKTTKIYRAHKIRLDPNSDQEVFFRKCVGTSRFVYNWALAQCQQDYRDGGKPNWVALSRRLTDWKDDEFPWMDEVPCRCVHVALRHLGDAFDRFFKKQNDYPRFKKKHGRKQSACMSSDGNRFHVDGRHVRLPKIGCIKTFEEFRYPGARLLSCTLKLEAGRWFAVVNCEMDAPTYERTTEDVGIDLGLTSALTLSTAEKILAPKPLKWAQRKLRRLQRSASRKKKGSQNQKKTYAKIARLHWRIAQIRNNFQHQATTAIAKRFGRVYVEDLNVKGMLKNHCLARSISDVGWGGLVEKLSYKTQVGKVSRWFPSSKTCSVCGHVVAELPLSVRTWVCEKCGTVHDRDVNSAVNVLVEGRRIFTVGCTGINACGEGSADVSRKRRVKLPSTKQESRTYILKNVA
jgi:putative transposase